MKKLFSLFMIFLVLFSIPLAIADEDDDSDDLDSDSRIEIRSETKSDNSGSSSEVRSESKSETEIKSKDGSVETKTRLRLDVINNRERIIEEFEERTRDLPEEARIRIKTVVDRRLEKLDEFIEIKQKNEFKDFKEELEFRARVLNKQELKLAEDRLEKARERFEEARERHLEAREKFLQSKKDKDECTENCDEVKQELIVSAKAHLSNSADAIIAHLNRVKERIQSSEELTEEQINEFVSAIDAKISVIGEAKVELEAATTGREVAAASKKINAAWKDSRLKINTISNTQINSRVGGIVLKSKKLETRLENVVNKLEENGTDTTEIQSLIDEFNAKVDGAQLKFEEAHKISLEAETGSIERAKELVKESKELLKEANEILREIVKKIKESNGEDELEETEDEDDEDEREIEVEIENGRAKVEIDINGQETEFELETTNLDDIVEEISLRTGLTKEEINVIMKLEVEDDDEED